jgi:hypothetical protein
VRSSGGTSILTHRLSIEATGGFLRNGVGENSWPASLQPSPSLWRVFRRTTVEADAAKSGRVTSCPVLFKFLVSHSCWQISSSTTSIFIFLSVEKFVDLPAHLLSEDQQGTLPALVKNALAVSLEQLVERTRSEFPLAFAHAAATNWLCFASLTTRTTLARLIRYFFATSVSDIPARRSWTRALRSTLRGARPSRTGRIQLCQNVALAQTKPGSRTT